MRTNERSASEAWIRVEIVMPAEAARADQVEDLLSGFLPDLGAHGLEYLEEPRRLRATFRSAEPPSVLADHVRNLLRATELGALPVAAEVIPSDDWAPFWESAFEPLRFGPLAIVPSWSPPPEDAAHVLVIDPSQAFGTGLHPTTALCLEHLVAAPPTGAVLDVGTGSGVLALAALRLGAERVVALDTDPVAVAAARKAAADNGLEAGLELFEGEVGDAQGSFQLVLANVRPDPLVAMADDLRARLAPEGRLVLSGMREDEVEAVAQAYAALGLTVAAREVKDGWVRLELNATGRT